MHTINLITPNINPISIFPPVIIGLIPNLMTNDPTTPITQVATIPQFTGSCAFLGCPPIVPNIISNSVSFVSCVKNITCYFNYFFYINF